MIDDDVGLLKEKPEDTRYINILHRNETRSIGSVDKLNIIEFIPCHYWGLYIWERSCISLPDGPERIWIPYPGAPPIIWLLAVLIPSQSNLYPFHAGRQRIMYNRPPSKPHLGPMTGWGVSIITKILHGTPIHRPSSRSWVYFFGDFSVVAIKDAISWLIENQILR